MVLSAVEQIIVRFISCKETIRNGVVRLCMRLAAFGSLGK